MTPLILLLLGCPKTPQSVESLWATAPRLPSPSAGTYTRSKEMPPDAAIRSLLKNQAWDASLSGAAGNLATQLSNPSGPKALTRWSVRSALWQAGYPYDVRDAKAWMAGSDGRPPPQLLAWLEALPPTDDLGLVRSRGHLNDVFVALAARPPVDLPPFPRQLATGSRLEFPALPGVTYAVADANGRLLEGSLEQGATVEANAQGEWLVRLTRGDQVISTFPVYVGLVPPTQPLITETVAVRETADALARATTLLESIRDTYGSPPPARDFLLDSGARNLLQDVDGDPVGTLTSLGVAPENAAVWVCRGTTVEICIDRMIWTPRNRRALLDDDARLGLAAEVDAKGVALVGILTRTD